MNIVRTSCRGAASLIPSSSSSSDRWTGRSARRGLDGRLDEAASIFLLALSFSVLSDLKYQSTRRVCVMRTNERRLTLRISGRAVRWAHRHRSNHRTSHHRFRPTTRRSIHCRRPATSEVNHEQRACVSQLSSYVLRFLF